MLSAHINDGHQLPLPDSSQSLKWTPPCLGQVVSDQGPPISNAGFSASNSQEKPLLFGPASGNLQFPACSQSSSAHQVLSTKNKQTQATLLPQGLSNKSSFRQPPGRRRPEALTLSSCNIKSISLTSPLRQHLHQDKAAWFPENGTQQARVRGGQAIPLGRGKLFYVEHSCVVTVPPLTLETRTPQTHQRRLETCLSSKEMEPGGGPSLSVPKFRPPSLIITHSKLQGTGQCGGRAGQGEAVLKSTRDILASGVLAPGTFQRVLLPHTPVLAAGWDGACLDECGVVDTSCAWGPKVSI